MKFHQPKKLEYIADLIRARMIGDKDFLVFGTNEIHRVNLGDLVFVDHPKYYEKALFSNASVILINKEEECPEGKALLISDDPFRDFNLINLHFSELNESGNHITGEQIGNNTTIHKTAVLGKNIKIGENCVIGPNVVISDRTLIGDNVIVQSGTILGGDAFYYRKTEKGFERLRSVGDVVLYDDVEIGSNCTIDRGITDSTIIGKGTKLDNQIQIGHDTIIGERCLIASQVGISGCCNIGNDVTVWGQVGISSSITIGDNTVVLAKTGVSKNLRGNTTYFGIPVEEAKAHYKRILKINQLIKQ